MIFLISRNFLWSPVFYVWMTSLPMLKKPDSPFLRNLQLSIVFQLGMGARESLPTPGLNTVWLVLMQLLCRHLCEFINAVVRSYTKDTLLLWSSPISDSSSLCVSSTMTVPEPCGGEGYRCPFVPGFSTDSYSLPFDQLWVPALAVTQCTKNLLWWHLRVWQSILKETLT